MARWIFALAFALVCYGNGAACIESFVNYPSWRLIGASEFTAYHAFIGPRVIAFLVAPALSGTVYRAAVAVQAGGDSPVVRLAGARPPGGDLDLDRDDPVADPTGAPGPRLLGAARRPAHGHELVAQARAVRGLCPRLSLDGHSTGRAVSARPSVKPSARPQDGVTNQRSIGRVDVGFVAVAELIETTRDPRNG